VTFPVSRQGLEQVALLLLAGALLFGVFALVSWRRGRQWRRFATSGGFLGALGLIAIGLAYTIAPNIPTPPVPLTARFAQNPVADSPATVAAGRAAYQANCAVCHGPQGRGDGPLAFTLQPRPFDLQVHVPQHAPGELYYWISEGVVSTPMPGWKDKLSETERWEVIRFLQALAAGRAS
jgi:mono/diheme cytochrome c family protein